MGGAYRRDRTGLATRAQARADSEAMPGGTRGRQGASGLGADREWVEGERRLEVQDSHHVIHHMITSRAHARDRQPSDGYRSARLVSRHTTIELRQLLGF